MHARPRAMLWMASAVNKAACKEETGWGGCLHLVEHGDGGDAGAEALLRIGELAVAELDQLGGKLQVGRGKHIGRRIQVVRLVVKPEQLVYAIDVSGREWMACCVERRAAELAVGPAGAAHPPIDIAAWIVI